jgi:hypothetical protein
MPKILKFSVYLYVFYVTIKMYNLFYSAWFTYNINFTANSSNKFIANGVITGYNLLRNDIVNTANGNTYGLYSLMGLPFVFLIVLTSLVICYLGFKTNSFLFCLAPYLANILVRAQISSMEFKMLNPVYGGTFNSSTGASKLFLAYTTNLGLLSLLVTTYAFIIYKRENNLSAGNILSKIINHSKNTETV